MFERPKGGERAVLVHLNLHTGFDEESLLEFKELVVSSGAEPVAVVTGSRAVPHPRYFVGTGKAEEIKETVLNEEADVVLFIVDARDGLVGGDQEIAKRLRAVGKKVHLVVNKVDGAELQVVIAEFYNLGLGEPLGITASQRGGVNDLMTEVLPELDESEIEDGEEDLEEERSTEPSDKKLVLGGCSGVHVE